MTTDIAVPEKHISRRRWWTHLILIGGYFAAAIPLALARVPHRPALLGTTEGLLIVCGFQIALFLVVFGLGWLASRASPEMLLLKWRQGWLTVPIGLAYSIAMRIGIGIVLAVIVAVLLTTGLLPRESLAAFTEEGRTAAEKIVDLSAMQNNRAYFWLTITLVSFVVAGLREELWRAGSLAAMRALWPNLFEGRDGQIAGVACIAIVFGLGHLAYGPVSAAMAAILGFILGVIMVMHQSIWPAVIAHGAFDATTFALVPWVQHFRHLQ